MDLSISELSRYLTERDFGPSMELTLCETKETDHALPWKGPELPWNGLTCLSVVCYVLKFCSDSNNSDVFHTIRKLNHLASKSYEVPQASDYCDSITRLTDIASGCAAILPEDWADAETLEDLAFSYVSNSLKFYKPDLSYARKLQDMDSQYERMLCLQICERNPRKLENRREFAETFVNSFMPKVQQFFAVSVRTQHLTGFIYFLLQLLSPETDHIRYEGHERHVIEPIHPFLLGVLYKGLKFLLAVLGDVPFRFTEMEEVKNLLTGFNDVADEVGSFIYSYIFRTCPINVCQFCVDIRALLQKVDLLNAKIKEHCIQFRELHLFVPSNPIDTDAADSFVIVNSLLKDLENFLSFRNDVADDVKDQIRTLHEFLTCMRPFVDADLPQELEIQEWKECVIQIRETAYEADYLINSFVVRNFPDWYLSIRIPNVIQKLMLMVEIFKELLTIFRIKNLRQKEDLTRKETSEAVVPTSTAIDDQSLVGFDSEFIGILDELTGGKENLQIISICGMPGLGKTTLAKRIYNHGLIVQHFDECAWCVVSQTYQKRKVLIELLMNLRRMQDKDIILEMEDEILISEIYKTLKGRRYLIVMDDIWGLGVWDDLRRYFPNDRNRSRILSTSRIGDTAPEHSIIHKLPLLSEDQCWELLEKKVFHGQPCPPQLRGSGKRIAAKCNGLPLAVVVIAGALANMAKEKNEWQNVEQSLNTYTSDIMYILELSYKHLPNHLKVCFLYLGVFPEDAQIPVKKLIWLWIAEGFIRNDGDKSQEHVAREYLMDLIDRSLVLVARSRSTGGVKACSVHDLLRDMCLIRAQEVNFLKLIKEDGSSSYEKHQRLFVHSTAPAHLRPFSLHCRSFFGNLSDPSCCLPQMKHLRVLKLSVPDNIGLIYKFKWSILNSVLLRYLVVDRMPESEVLGNLVNLEVLCVESLVLQVYIPSVILKMVKLRHLDVKDIAIFKDDCDSSEQNNLHSLSNISIEKTKDYEILTCSPHLRKLKCRCTPVLPDFCFLTKLESLNIVVTDWVKIPQNMTPINFPQTIKKLSLHGTCLPWKRMSILGRLPQLQSLKLHTTVLPKGLPQVVWSAFEGKEWKTRDDEFLELRYLELCRLDLEQWITSSEHFPKLCRLVLSQCYKLQEIPAELGSIPTLRMIAVYDCSYEAGKSALQIEQEQRDNGNEELEVFTTGVIR